MEKLLQAIRQFEKAGEELVAQAGIAALGHKINLSTDEAHALMDRISYAEILGARSERMILEAVALNVALEVLKRQIAEQSK